MEFLNIGIPELLIILLLMLILLGPDGMAKTARVMAKEIRKFIRSPLWADLVKAQRDIQELPTRFVREAGIDELKKELEQTGKQVQADINTPLTVDRPETAAPETPVGPYPQVVPPQDEAAPEDEFVIRPPQTIVQHGEHKDEDLP